MMGHVPTIPESTRSSITVRLLDHAEKNWPQLAKVRARYHGSFAYITGVLRDGQQISRCSGCATAAPPTPSASRSTHPPATATENAVLRTGLPTGTPQEAPRHRLHRPPRRPDTNPN